MNSKSKPSRVFTGWWMTIISGVTTGLGQAFCLRGFSALLKPISTELGFSRAVASGASGIRSLQFGVLAPVTGWLCDRFGPKWIIVTGMVFVVIGLILMNYVNSLWAYYVTWGLIIGMGNTLALTIAPDKALTDWFVTRRGRAFSIRFILIATLSAAFLPLITWLIAVYGWRTSCLIWACVMAVALPFLGTIIKEKRPEHYGLSPDGWSGRETRTTTTLFQNTDHRSAHIDGHEELELSLRQAMKTQAYWMLILVNAFGMIVQTGFGLHCIPFITDLGIDPTVAGGMMAMMILFGIPSNFLGCHLADHFKKEHLKYIMAGAFASQALGVALFLLKPGAVMLYIFLILFGFGIGPLRPLLIIIRSRFYGRKAYGSIEGMSLSFEMPFSFLSPIYAGWIYDRTGSYKSAFILFALLSACAAFTMVMVRPPAPASKEIA